MIRIRFALAAIVGLAASLAHAAGFQRIEVPASGVLPLLKGAVWYPCAEPTSDLKLGPFVLSVTKDCPVTGEKLPLVVISHGRTGSYLGHRDTAEALANAGFVVVAVMLWSVLATRQTVFAVVQEPHHLECVESLELLELAEFQ